MMLFKKRLRLKKSNTGNENINCDKVKFN